MKQSHIAFALFWAVVLVVPRAVGRFAGEAARSRVMGLSTSDPAYDQFRGGFEDVSDDFEGFAGIWEDSTEIAFARASTRLIPMHATDEELRSVYEVRQRLFALLANDENVQRLCMSDPTAALDLDSEMRSAFMTPELMAITGRVLAREHSGHDGFSWTEGALDDESEWTTFFEYLDGIGESDVADFLYKVATTDPREVDPAEACHAQADLYAAAVTSPNDVVVGGMRLLELMRTIDFIAAEATTGRHQS